MIRLKNRKIWLLFMGGILLMPLMLSFITVPKASAAPSTEEQRLEATIKAVTITAVQNCKFKDKIALDDLENASTFAASNFLGSNTATTYRLIGDTGEYTTNCDELIPLYTNFASDISPRQFLESIGYVVDGSVGLKFDGSSSQLSQNILRKYSAGSLPNLNDPPVKYELNKNIFFAYCTPIDKGLRSDLTDQVIINALKNPGKYVEANVIGDTGVQKRVYKTTDTGTYSTGGGRGGTSCATPAGNMSDAATQLGIAADKESAQAKEIIMVNALTTAMCPLNAGSAVPGTGDYKEAQSVQQTCIAKYQAAYAACKTITNPGTPINRNTTIPEKAACIAKATGGKQADILDALTKGKAEADKVTTDLTGSTGTAECTTEDPDCDIPVVCTSGALGWFLCPLATFLHDATLYVADYLQTLLIFKPLLVGNNGAPLKAIWTIVLSIANVLLVIVVLVVIFSQATSVGLSNYGIKKMLPRLAVAAVLMNLSFYICALGIDIANVLGEAVKGIVSAGFNQITLPPGATKGPGVASTVLTVLLASVGTAIAGVAGLLPLLLPVIATGFVAFMTAFLVVGFRLVLVTLLVVVSPLAFLAMVLPNTQGLFTKWRKLFLAMMFMYPIIMAVFYGSALVSAIILASDI